MRPHRALRPLVRNPRSRTGHHRSTPVDDLRVLHLLRRRTPPRAQPRPARTRPKQNYESSTLGLDRNELGGFLVQAGLCGGRDHALACLLALNGLAPATKVAMM